MLRPLSTEQMPSATPNLIAEGVSHATPVEHTFSKSVRGSRSLILIGILVLLALLQFFVPRRTAIKIGADEDWELSKATLALNGHHFYTEVWNDQPLLHTWIITKVLKHVSPGVLGPRLVTSGFTLLLVTAVFWIGLRLSGTLVAAVASVLVIASPGFLELSSSCMVEIPALAPAVAAVAVLLSKPRITDHASRLTYHASTIVAGVLFGISLQIKFINVVLLPIVPLILWLNHRRVGASPSPLTGRGQGEGLLPRLGIKSLILPLLTFSLSLLITFVALTFLTGAEAYWVQLKQSWSAHFAATKSFEYGSPADHPFEWSVYLKNWDTTIPALIGILFCFRNFRNQPLLLIPVAWFALTLVVFGIHKPWWSYYYIHNAVPLCICAAIGIAAVVNWLRSKSSPILYHDYRHFPSPPRPRRGQGEESSRVRGEGRGEGLFRPGRSFSRRRVPIIALATVCGLAIAGWMAARVYLQITQIRSSPKIFSSLALKEIERYKPLTKFIYTDEPAYSFHSGIPMPPALAVITLKRLWSGDMTNARLVEELKLTKPGLMLLKNQTAELPFSDWMQTEYRLVYQDGRHNLYAHKSIANKVE
jgi:hypothetical protein